MIALVQRVSEAAVRVDGKVVGEIDEGFMVLVGVQKTDTQDNVKALADKLLKFRIFPDDDGKMNLNIAQANGELLLVPQFTLAASTERGNRPSFDTAAPPELAATLFAAFCDYCRDNTALNVQTGQFQADMKVSLVNDGPLTFWLEK